MITGSLRYGLHQDFEGFRGGVGRKIHGGGGFSEREDMGQQGAHIQFPREDKPGDLVLKSEISGIAAQKVFLIHTDSRQAAWSRSACQKHQAASLVGSPIIPESVNPKNSTRSTPSTRADS